MTFPRLALVEAPVYDAAVLYEFNIDSSAFVEHDGVDFGVPEWSAAPGAVGGEDGYRTVAFTHLTSPDYAVAWQELTVLSRLLLSQQQWLLIQMSQASAPRWFKTWRSTPAALSPDLIQKKTDGDLAGLWGIALSLTADPYLYGEQVSLPSVSIANDPSGPYPMCAVLPEVEGDAPAPLTVEVTASQAWYPTPLIATGATEPVLIDLGAGDGVTDGSFATIVTDSKLIGGSGRTWTLAAGASGALGPFSVPTSMAPGTYRVLARVGVSQDTAGASATLAIWQSIGGTSLKMPPVTLATGVGSITLHGWVDLGPVLYPAAHNDERPYVGTVPDKLRWFYLGATRTSGDMALTLDAVLFLPVQLTPVSAGAPRGALSFVSQAAIGGLNGSMVVDGDAERIPLQTFSTQMPAIRGVFPSVHPGEPNVLLWVPWLLDTSRVVEDDLTAVFDFEVSYLPRYLWPAP